MNGLSQKKCIPCKGNVPPLPIEERRRLIEEIPGWTIVNEHHLTKTFQIPDFRQALSWVNKVGEVAEAENHHPDIYLTWGRVKIDIWTHKINNLTESDFILAAKIDRI